MVKDMSSSSDGDKTRTIQVHYRNSPTLVTVIADGGIGGVSPRGMITVALYHERGPIPRITEINVTSDGSVSSERTIEARTGLIRQIDCELMMTPEAAIGLGKWLTQNGEQ